MKFLNKQFEDLTGLQLVLLITALLWIKTIIVCFIGFNLHTQSVFDIILILTAPIGSLLLVMGFSFYFWKKVNKHILFGFLVIGTGILFGDLLYYRFYNDFVTIPILFQFNNVGGLSASTVELMSWSDILLFVDIIIIGWFIYRRKPSLVIQKQKKRKYIMICSALIAVTIGLGLTKSVHLFSESYDREQMVQSLGLLNYHLYDIALGIKAPLQQYVVTKADADELQEYFPQEKPDHTDLFGIAKGKNIILIMMESTQDFVINRKVNGKEITPFLNELIKDSYYFTQIYDQTAQGKTSDAELMIDTGLYPLASGSVFVRKPENTYQSLPHLLKEKNNYHSAVFHGNVRTFWNRETMYDSLGYDTFYSKRDYNVTEENAINYGLKDIPFFHQSLSYLESLPEPYYAKFITLTNHFPFLLADEDMFIDLAATKEDVVNRYVTTVRYLDRAIEMFFEELKEKGMYEDTIFVLAGDHYGISQEYEKGLSELLDEEVNIVSRTEQRQIPLIIHVPGQGGETIAAPGGQIDIHSTLLHLLGVEVQDSYSFGHNLFTRSIEHPVIFRDGSFLSKEYIYSDNICYRKENGEPIDKQHCEAYFDLVREELALSDDIIFGNLLRFKIEGKH